MIHSGKRIYLFSNSVGIKVDKMKRLQDQCCKISLQILIYTSIILLSPIILTTLLSLYVYKCGILRLIIKYFKPKLLQELNEHDAFYATDRFWEDSRANFGLVLVLDGNISLEQVGNIMLFVKLYE